ncbi:hypothetical protein E3P78_00390 [Wallemia ichthyophaga]|nr:hypothetical protein E3P78_00390 [Wallemia ichthyophaga]
MSSHKRQRSSTPAELSLPGQSLGQGQSQGQQHPGPPPPPSPESKKGRGRPRKSDKGKGPSLSPTLPQNELEPANNAPPKKAEEDDDDEIDDDWMEDDEFERERLQSKKAKEDLGILLQHFSPEQLQRYEVYRRAALNKSTIRKLCNQTLNQSVSQNVSIIVSGFSKVFVGEIVEKARQVQQSWGQSGPLSADQIREAHRLYQKDKGAHRKPFAYCWHMNDTIGACTILNKNPNTPLSASGHHVCATFSLPPINGAIIAIDTGNTTKKMIAELSKPERTVKRIDLGEVTNLFISPTEPSFSSLRVPAGMGMWGRRITAGRGIRSINCFGICKACHGTRLCA